jgi:hypothetical protein
MTETPRGIVRIEYGVEYLDPPVYSGLVVELGREEAERRAKAENTNVGVRCQIVVRKVTVGPWQPQELAENEDPPVGLS